MQGGSNSQYLQKAQGLGNVVSGEDRGDHVSALHSLSEKAEFIHRGVRVKVNGMSYPVLMTHLAASMELETIIDYTQNIIKPIIIRAFILLQTKVNTEYKDLQRHTITTY